MEALLSEHSEAILYGIMGMIMVLLICSVGMTNWQKSTPAYKRQISGSNEAFINSHSGKFPVIEADEVIFAEYRDERFDFKDYITAKDCDGRDISQRVDVYGRVDVFQKGLYKLRCVVVADNRLTCTKYVNVIVE